MRTRLSIAVALLTILSLALAQRIVVEPQGIVVNPLPDPTFTVSVFLDRDPTGDGRPTYNVGDTVQIGVTTNQDAYIYLYDVKPDGQVTQILPNRFDEPGRNNFVLANQTKFFPPQGARYVFAIDPPNGLSKVIAVASRTPLNTDPLATYGDGGSLATSNIGEAGFAEAFGIVVRPVPQQEWVTDTVLYYVGARPSVPAFGTLRLESSPRGAEVFVDGQFAGYTPTQLGVRPGDRSVEFRLDGYVSLVTGVSVAGGEVRTLGVTLQAVAAPTPAPTPAPTILLFDDPFLVGLPGARLLALEVRNQRRDASFTITAGLDSAYQHFHSQLIGNGWTRTELRLRDDRIDAEYRRDGRRFDFELRERNDRYDLDIRFRGGGDDDDDDDD